MNLRTSVSVALLAALGAALLLAAASPATAGEMTVFEGESTAVVVGPGITVRLSDVPAETATGLDAARRFPRAHVQGEFEQYELPGAAAALDRDSPAPSGAPTDSPEGTNDVGLRLVDFQGLTSTGWIPPDTVIAVGPRDVVEVTNSGFAVYSKHGEQRQGYTNLETFFQPAWPGGWNSANGFLFDPRVEYHAGQDKFVLLALGADFVAQTSHVFFAISQTSDPTGAWWLYRVDNVLGSDAWLDYAGLGVDNFGLYFTGNLFFYAGGFKGSIVAHFGTALYSGNGSSGCYKSSLTWPAGGSAFSLQAAHPHSIAGGSETFFVNTFSGSGNQILLWELTGDRTACTSSLTRGAISTAAYQAIGQNVDQGGSATDIDGGDARVMDAVYANRRVFATLASDQAGTGARSEFFVEKLDVDAISNDWQWVYFSTGLFYFYPSITLRGSSASAPLAVGLSFTWPSNGAYQYASTAVKIFTAQGSSDAGPFPVAAAGLGSYVLLDSNNRNRWGDYSGADYDWDCGDVWTALEYAGPPNSWRTRVNRWNMNDSPTLLFADGFESGHWFCWTGSVD